MDKLYYQEYYFLERNHWWFKVREEILKDHLYLNIPEKKNTLKILNIGAATGKTTEMLSNFGEVTSIEYDQDCCEFVNNKTGIKVINASILELPFPD